MASGHVNRIKRPNTWLHRPMLQNVKKALANPEPSTHGTFRTSRCRWMRFVHRGKPRSFKDAQRSANDPAADIENILVMPDFVGRRAPFLFRRSMAKQIFAKFDDREQTMPFD